MIMIKTFIFIERFVNDFVRLTIKNVDYFIVRILKSRVREEGEILLTRGNGNFLATGFLIWNKFPFFFLTAVRLDLSGSGFLTFLDLNLRLWNSLVKLACTGHKRPPFCFQKTNVRYDIPFEDKRKITL